MTTVGEMMGYGLIVTFIGMGMCFVVLVGLAYMLNALKLLSNKGTPEKKTEVVKLEDNEAPAAVNNAPAEDEGELVAAISAALAALMGSSSNLVIKSISRVEGNAPVWARVGRQEQMFNRL